jgi:hypothetical protein
MGNCSVDNRNLDKRSHGLLGCLVNTWRHLVGLPVSPTDLASAISGDDHGSKAETSSTLDHRRTTFDLYGSFDRLILCFTRHFIFPIRQK